MVCQVTTTRPSARAATSGKTPSSSTLTRYSPPRRLPAPSKACRRTEMPVPSEFWSVQAATTPPLGVGVRLTPPWVPAVVPFTWKAGPIGAGVVKEPMETAL